jgi:hypothetical protein
MKLQAPRNRIEKEEPRKQKGMNMKSRLALSILSILIAASFTSDALGVFETIRSWTGNIVHCFVVEACDHVSSDTAPTTSNKGSNQGKIKLIQMDEGRLPGSEICSTAKFMTTAVRQVREVVALMRMK